MSSIKEYKVKSTKVDFKRIFLLSDTHFGVRANNIEWIHNHLSFFKDFYIPFLKEHVQPGDALFFLGDWYDNRQLLDILVMNVSVDIMRELASILPVHIITGNHDIYKKHDTDVNSLRSFKYLDNVFIYEKPEIVTNGKESILLLSWIGDKEKEEQYASINKADYLFAHTDMAGFRYDNGRQIVKGVQVFDIEHYKRIFSGHIHKRQEFNKAIYIGSPYHTKRSDIGNNKGVYIFDPSKNEVEFFENNHSPIFQRIYLQEMAHWTLEKTKKYLHNNYTDIIVPDKYIQLFNLTKFIELFSDCKYKRIETRGEQFKLDDSLSTLVDGDEIKDILTLLDLSIDDLLYNQEMIEKLKELNKLYYDKVNNEEN